MGKTRIGYRTASRICSLRLAMGTPLFQLKHRFNSGTLPCTDITLSSTAIDKNSVWGPFSAYTMDKISWRDFQSKTSLENCYAGFNRWMQSPSTDVLYLATKLRRSHIRFKRKKRISKVNYLNIKSNCFLKFTGFVTHIRIANTASIKPKIIILIRNLRLKNPLGNFVLCSILKWSSSKFCLYLCRPSGHL